MATRICPHCGYVNDAGAADCEACGGSLATVSQATDAATPPPAPPANTAPPTSTTRPSTRPAAAARRPAPRQRTARWVIGGVIVAVLAVATGWGARRFIAAMSTDPSPGATLVVPAADMTSRQVLGAEKDSLLTEVLETTTLLNDLNNAVTAVATGRAPAIAESSRPLTAREARAILLPKIDSLRIRLNASESHLAASLATVHHLTASEAQLRQQIAGYEQTVASVRKVVADQQQQLNGLDSELTSLRAENQKLRETQTQMVATQSALQDTVTGLKETENTVYWVAGTRSALLELGIVTEEGSGKVLIFGKGKTLVPARNFAATDFTAINKTQTTTITLPKPNQKYRILSRQNLSAIKNALDKDGHVRGTIEISDPAAFWEASPYLILVEE